MSDAIITALIGAGTTIIVTLITVNAQRKSKEVAPASKTVIQPDNGTRAININAHKKIWIIVILLSLVWIILSPILINHDLAGTNTFLIGGIIILLAFLKPVNPATPVILSITLMLLAIFMEPIAKYIKFPGSIQIEGMKWTPVIATIAVAALISGVVSYFRLKQFR